jgi:hypothetical protein
LGYHQQGKTFPSPTPQPPPCLCDRGRTSIKSPKGALYTRIGQGPIPISGHTPQPQRGEIHYKPKGRRDISQPPGGGTRIYQLLKGTLPNKSTTTYEYNQSHPEIKRRQ